MLGQLYEDGGDARRAAYCFLTAAADSRRRVEWERARTLYLRAVRLLEIDDAVAKMDALYALGDVAARMGRTREALSHFQEMLRLAWRLDLPAKGGAAQGRIGRLHGQLGEPRAALGHLNMARQLFEVAGDRPGLASTLDDIGRVHLQGGDPEASLECHREAYQVRDQLGDDRGRALALARMGQVERETGDLVAAEGHLRQAIELRRRAGDRQGIVASLLDLGTLERDFGRIDRAVAILEEARVLARELGERLFECSIAIALGDCRLTDARPLDARPHFIEAKQIARQFGAKLLLGDACRGLAEVELARGEALDARDEARVAFEIAERIGAPPLAGAALRVVASAVGLGAPGDSDLGRGARDVRSRRRDLEQRGRRVGVGADAGSLRRVRRANGSESRRRGTAPPSEPDPREDADVGDVAAARQGPGDCHRMFSSATSVPDGGRGSRGLGALQGGQAGQAGEDRPYARLDPRRATGRLAFGLVVGTLTAYLWPDRHSLAVRIVAGWDAGALVLLSFVWFVILTADPQKTKGRAAGSDPGRTVAWILVLLASSFSLFAGAVVLRHARTIEPARSTLLIGLCLAAVITAWSLTHTSFTLRYAHLYYRDDGEGEGGLGFPGERKPDDFDFAYFAFTVGMCFQVSDVVVTSPQIRRAVLGHAVLSFAYNTVIVALVLNLLFGFLS